MEASSCYARRPIRLAAALHRAAADPAPGRMGKQRSGESRSFVAGRVTSHRGPGALALLRRWAPGHRGSGGAEPDEARKSFRQNPKSWRTRRAGAAGGARMTGRTCHFGSSGRCRLAELCNHLLVSHWTSKSHVLGLAGHERGCAPLHAAEPIKTARPARHRGRRLPATWQPAALVARPRSPRHVSGLRLSSASTPVLLCLLIRRWRGA